MAAPYGTPWECVRTWWASPPRSGMQRLINPWEYRHLRGCGMARIAGGAVAGSAGLICLAYRADGWAGFFFAIAGADLAGGYWYLTVARSTPARS